MIDISHINPMIEIINHINPVTINPKDFEDYESKQRGSFFYQDDDQKLIEVYNLNFDFIDSFDNFIELNELKDNLNLIRYPISKCKEMENHKADSFRIESVFDINVNKLVKRTLEESTKLERLEKVGFAEKLVNKYDNIFNDDVCSSDYIKDKCEYLAAEDLEEEMETEIDSEIENDVEVQPKFIVKLRLPSRKSKNHISITRHQTQTKTKSKQFNNQRYFSRLNIQQLSKILKVKDIKQAKKIEKTVLKIFKESCKFDLGYKTWIRDTTKMERIELVNLLFGYTKKMYPNFSKDILEIIIRRGSYAMMQTRLRKERRGAECF